MPSLTLKTLVERQDTGAGRAFELFIQSLIIISLISFCLETLRALPPSWRLVLGSMEAVIVIIFTLEYLLRIWVADNKLKYIFSFYGLVDIAAILPFYVSTGIDLRSLRIVRVFRILRTVKLVRYTSAIQRLHSAFLIAKEEVLIFFFMALILIFIASMGIYYFENPAQPEAYSSVFASLWWAVITLTTVGYGDLYPVTVGGRAFTCVILIVGLGIIAVPTAIIASALTRVRDIERDKHGDESG